MLGIFFTPRDIVMRLIIDPDDFGYWEILLNNQYGYIGAYCGCHIEDGMICVIILGNQVFDYIPENQNKMDFPLALVSSDY